MKSYVLVMMCLMAGLVPSHAADAWKIPHDPELLSFLQRIETGYQQIRDLECELEETYVGPEGAKKIASFSLSFLHPNRRKKVGLGGSSGRRIELELGSDSWHITHPKSVSRTTWTHPPNFIPLPLFRAGISPRSGRLMVKRVGQEIVDGEPCVRVEGQQHEYWIAERDGLPRKQVSGFAV